MNYEIKKVDDITVFKLNEKRLDTNISGLVKGEFTLLLKVEGATKLIIDMSDVESCDSSGLSAILVANRILNSTGGSMRIAAPSEKVSSLMRITQLDRVLTVCDTVDEAFEELKNEKG
ncbi:MAG: anti-anti-sigma factor [Ignavibacteria bacterium RBG_16_34_14]|nr:MAG: anti-anti-sigma factor [Ignavibacteria bacterium RBG_16_34_14]